LTARPCCTWSPWGEKPCCKRWRATLFRRQRKEVGGERVTLALGFSLLIKNFRHSPFFAGCVSSLLCFRETEIKSTGNHDTEERRARAQLLITPPKPNRIALLSQHYQMTAKSLWNLFREETSAPNYFFLRTPYFKILILWCFKIQFTYKKKKKKVVRSSR